MAERVLVRQDRDFTTTVMAADPHDEESENLSEVHHLHELTPYGMLMVSLATCTGIVLHTYAQHHGVDLREVAFDLRYDRVFAEDCAECEDIEAYREHIDQEITLSGSLSERDRSRLYAVSHHCPIHQILTDGMTVDSHLVEA